MTPHRRSTRAIELLDKVVALGDMDRTALANDLVVTKAQLTAYLDGDAEMPLDRQLCLARLVIERIPALARLGHRLHGQVRAAIAFSERVTTTHADAPPLTFR